MNKLLIEGDYLSKNNIIEMDQLTDLAYYILLSLLEEKHGYSIMKHVETLTNGEVTIGPASLYPSLKKLQHAGFIQLLEDKHDRRKTYLATQKGKIILMNEIERRSKMVDHGKSALKSSFTKFLNR